MAESVSAIRDSRFMRLSWNGAVVAGHRLQHNLTGISQSLDEVRGMRSIAIYLERQFGELLKATAEIIRQRTTLNEKIVSTQEAATYVRLSPDAFRE